MCHASCRSAKRSIPQFGGGLGWSDFIVYLVYTVIFFPLEGMISLHKSIKRWFKLGQKVGMEVLK